MPETAKDPEDDVISVEEEDEEGNVVKRHVVKHPKKVSSLPSSTHRKIQAFDADFGDRLISPRSRRTTPRSQWMVRRNKLKRRSPR